MISEITQWVHHQFVSNNVFSGVVGGGLFASIAYTLRLIPEKLRKAYLYYFTCTLIIRDQDEAFGWMVEWLAKHPYAQKTRRFKLSDSKRRSQLDEDIVDGAQSDDEPKWVIAPGEGKHWFFHGGRLIWLTREVEKSPGQNNYSSLVENIHLRVFSRKSHYINDLISEAADIKKGDKSVEIYKFGSYNWYKCASKVPRNLSSIILPCGQIERIVDDANCFFESKAWYLERGVPYRRGYLFYGPPGTGKSSLVFALASHFGRPLYSLNMGSTTSDDRLSDAFARVPPNAILLIEDIDASHISEDRSKAEKKKTPMSLSCLLNLIDGAVASDGRLLVMTTNYPEILDDALTRPGRIDLKEKIDFLEEEEVRRMVNLFFPSMTDIADSVKIDSPLPAAVVQGHLIECRGQPEALVGRLLEESRKDSRKAA